MGYILALGTILRLVFINQSLWLDEASEALALMGKSGVLLSYILADYQPPLYHGITYLLTHLLGYSEVVFRLPSLLSGIFTIYFVTKMGELLANRKIGILAGLLAATNPLLIYYSQEGRTYAMTTFFVTGSFYYFLQLLKEKKRSFYLLYSIFTILFIWTSYLSWFLLLAQIAYVIRLKRFDILKSQLLSGLSLLFWLPYFIKSLNIGRYTLSISSAWGSVVGGSSWKSLPLTWVKFNIGRISFDDKLLYAAITAVIFIAHLYILRRFDWKKYHVLLLWLIPPVILGLLVAIILPVYSYFRVLFVLPAYLLALSIGLASFKRNYLLCFILSCNLIFLGISWINPQFRHEDWRSLTRDLQLDPSSTIAMPSREQGSGLYYYGITVDRVIEPKNDKIVGDRIYYVRYAEDLFDVNKVGITNLVNSGYTITRQKVYPGIQVDIYEK